MLDNRTALDKLHAAESARRSEAAEAARRNAGVSALLGAGQSGIDLDEAEFIPISVNEASILQKMSETEPGQPRLDDPVALGMAAWARPLARLKYYVGKFRMDAMRWKDGKRHFTSLGFIKRAVDELFDGDGRPLPMWAIYLTENDDVSTDAAEQPVAIFTRRGIRFLVPVLMEAGGSTGGSGSGGAFLRAPGAQTELHCQGDGNAVMYDVRPGIIQPEGANDRNGWVALATFAGGKIRDFREDGNYRA